MKTCVSLIRYPKDTLEKPLEKVKVRMKGRQEKEIASCV